MEDINNLTPDNIEFIIDKDWGNMKYIKDLYNTFVE